MSVSLQFQSVYCERESLVRPATTTIIAITLLLLVLVFKIWIRVNIVDYGYGLAATQRDTRVLVKELQELELQQSILLRQDNLLKAASSQGLAMIQADQVLHGATINGAGVYDVGFDGASPVKLVSGE